MDLMRRHRCRWAGSYAATGELKKYGDLDRLSLFFLSIPAMRATVTCKTRKNTQTIDFIIF
jgi:hypothetical protein